MSSYYILINHSRADLQVVDDYELGDFDYRLLFYNDPIESLPEEVRLFVTPGTPADLLANPLSWTIVSKRCYQLMRPFLNDVPHEVHNPHTMSVETNKALRNYRLLHLMITVDATIRKGREFVEVDQTIIDVDTIPTGVHMFRLSDRPSLVCISHALMEALKGKGLGGLLAVHTTDGKRVRRKK